MESPESRPQPIESTPSEAEQLRRVEAAHEGFTQRWWRRLTSPTALHGAGAGAILLKLGLAAVDYGGTGGLLTGIGMALHGAGLVAGWLRHRQNKQREAEETFEIAFQEEAPQSAAQEFIAECRKTFNNFTFEVQVEPADQTKEPPYIFVFDEPRTLEEAKAQYALLRHIALKQGRIIVTGPTPYYNAESDIRSKIRSMELREKLGIERRKEIEEIARTRREERDPKIQRVIDEIVNRGAGGAGSRGGGGSIRYKGQEVTRAELRKLLEDMVDETAQPKKIKREPLPSEPKEAAREGAAAYLEQLGDDVLRALAGKMSDEEISRARYGTVGYYLRPSLHDRDQRDKVLFFIAHMVRHELVEYMKRHPEAEAKLSPMLTKLSKDPTLSGESIIEIIGPMNALWAEDLVQIQVPEAAQKVAEYRRGVARMEAGRESGVLDFERLKLPQARARLEAAEAELDDAVIRSIRGQYREQKRQVLDAKLRVEKGKLVPTGRQQVQVIFPAASKGLPDLTEAARTPDPGKKIVRKLRSKTKEANLSDAEREKIRIAIRELEEEKERLRTRINDLAEQRASEQQRARAPLTSRQERETALHNATRINGEILKLRNGISAIDKKIERLQRTKTVTTRYIEEKEVAVEPVDVGIIRPRYTPLPKPP